MIKILKRWYARHFMRCAHQARQSIGQITEGIVARICSRCNRVTGWRYKDPGMGLIIATDLEIKMMHRLVAKLYRKQGLAE